MTENVSVFYNQHTRKARSRNAVCLLPRLGRKNPPGWGWNQDTDYSLNSTIKIYTLRNSETTEAWPTFSLWLSVWVCEAITTTFFGKLSSLTPKAVYAAGFPTTDFSMFFVNKISGLLLLSIEATYKIAFCKHSLMIAYHATASGTCSASNIRVPPQRAC